MATLRVSMWKQEPSARPLCLLLPPPRSPSEQQPPCFGRLEPAEAQRMPGSSRTCPATPWPFGGRPNPESHRDAPAPCYQRSPDVISGSGAARKGINQKPASRVPPIQPKYNPTAGAAMEQRGRGRFRRVTTRSPRRQGRAHRRLFQLGGEKRFRAAAAKSPERKHQPGGLLGRHLRWLHRRAPSGGHFPAPNPVRKRGCAAPNRSGFLQ